MRTARIYLLLIGSLLLAACGPNKRGEDDDGIPDPPPPDAPCPTTISGKVGVPISGGPHLLITDVDGNPVAGVTFTLYSPAGSTAGVPTGTAGLSCQTDATGGCTISDVAPGTYTIDETPPTGYGKDAQFPKDNVVVTDGGTVTINAIDPRLFTIITLVCNQVNSSLYPSSIAVDSGTASNSESGAQIGTLLQTWATAQGLGTLTTAQKNAFQTALCGITNGARGDRRAAPDASNPHSVSVDIPN